MYLYMKRSVCLSFRSFFFFFWGGGSFCGLYCPNVFVFLACGGTWRCEHTLFCVEIVKRHIQIFIHSIIHSFVHSQYSLALHCVRIDYSGQNVTQCYHRGELAQGDLTRGEMGKGEWERHTLQHLC